MIFKGYSRSFEVMSGQKPGKNKYDQDRFSSRTKFKTPEVNKLPEAVSNTLNELKNKS